MVDGVISMAFKSLSGWSHFLSPAMLQTGKQVMCLKANKGNVVTLCVLSFYCETTTYLHGGSTQLHVLSTVILIWDNFEQHNHLGKPHQDHRGP